MSQPKICSFEGCDRVRIAKGLCRGHYTQLNRGWELKPLGEPRKKEVMLCSFEGCSRKTQAFGLCDAHYRQKKRGIPLRSIHKVTKSIQPEECSFSECGRVVLSKELCKTHYEQSRRGLELKPIGPYRDRGATYKKCPSCGTEFKVTRKSRKFCSMSCSTENQKSPIRKAIDAGDSTLILDEVKKNTIEDNNGCWVWQGRFNGEYASLSSGQQQRVHRLVLEAKLKAPLGVNEAHHTCYNSTCVKPEHLQSISKRENLADMRQKVFYEKRIEELESVVRSLDPTHEVLKSSHATQ